MFPQRAHNVPVNARTVPAMCPRHSHYVPATFPIFARAFPKKARSIPTEFPFHALTTECCANSRFISRRSQSDSRANLCSRFRIPTQTLESGGTDQMNVDEFLQSAHVRRRSKISAFDAEIRQLRAHGVSGQGIADFLRLNDVQISRRAVNQYLVRHPQRYCPNAKSASVPEGQVVQANTGVIAPLPLNQHPDQSGQRESTLVTPGAATTFGADALPSARPSSNPLHVVKAGEGLSRESANAGRMPVENREETTEPSHSLKSEETFPPTESRAGNTEPGSLPGESSNTFSNRDTFDSRHQTYPTYDGDTKPQSSPLLRYDPNDPKNIEAVASYKQRLRAGQIRTGETTNINRDRSTNEAQNHQPPDRT